MPIVSISLNNEILSELDKIQSSMGFSGRSEAIRAGIRSFVSEEKQKSNLSGNIHAILLVVHNDQFDHIVSGIDAKWYEQKAWLVIMSLVLVNNRNLPFFLVENGSQLVDHDCTGSPTP